MLKPSDLKTGKFVVMDGATCEVLDYSHKKLGRGGAIIKVKLRNIETGSITEKNLKGNEKIEEANLQFKASQYLYSQGDTFCFMDSSDFNQFNLTSSIIGDKKNFLKEGGNVEVVFSGGNPIGINLPIKVEYEVTEAQPGVKGDTASAATKEIKVETGYKLQAPLFIKAGDKVRIDTRDGKYIERAN